MAIHDFYQELRDKLHKTEFEKDLLQIIESMTDNMLVHSQIISLEPGEKLLGVGEKPNYTFFVLEGEFKVVNEFENGKSYAHLITYKEEITGFMEIVANYDYYISSIFAVKPSIVLRITREDTLELINSSHIFAKRLLSEISVAFINQSIGKGEKLLNTSLFGFVDYLVRQIEVSGDHSFYRINITREELSNRSGISLRTLYRNVSKLKDMGIISITRGKIILEENQITQLYELHNDLRNK